MNRIAQLFTISLLLIGSCFPSSAQTTVPNGSFETWVDHGSYANPQFWDTDNATANSIPLFGRDVVTQDPDCYDGVYGAKLETKNIAFFPISVPGILTLGTLSLDLLGGTYSLTGGFPIQGVPTHLRGFYKYYPAGGDSCGIAIGLSRTVNGKRDSLAYGTFTENSRVDVWTPFSAWIQYDTAAAPDSFNILIVGSAVEEPTAGTILFVDALSLDYSTGIDDEDAEVGIDVYNDKATKELLVYIDFPGMETTRLCLYDMMGRRRIEMNPGKCRKDLFRLDYSSFERGVYILEVLHDGKRFSRKFLF
jgi:hypothetical protein